jgi:hypothetical protein
MNRYARQRTKRFEIIAIHDADSPTAGPTTSPTTKRHLILESALPPSRHQARYIPP